MGMSRPLLGHRKQTAWWLSHPSETYWSMGRMTSHILSHDGSMVLVYMLTWLGYIDGKCYHIWHTWILWVWKIQNVPNQQPASIIYCLFTANWRRNPSLQHRLVGANDAQDARLTRARHMSHSTVLGAIDICQWTGFQLRDHIYIFIYIDINYIYMHIIYYIIYMHILYYIILYYIILYYIILYYIIYIHIIYIYTLYIYTLYIYTLYIYIHILYIYTHYIYIYII